MAVVFGAGTGSAPGALGATSPQLARGVLAPIFTETGLQPGQLQHGKYRVRTTFTAQGKTRRQTTASDTETEYWMTGQRWRTRTVEPLTRKVVSETLYQGPSVGIVVYYPWSGVMYGHSGPAPLPLPGWSAAYNRSLVEAGKLQSAGVQTVAGVTGTRYQLRRESPFRGHTIIVLQDGTFAPLLREEVDESPGKVFRQSEVLLEQQTIEAGTPSTYRDRLSLPTIRATIRRWRRAVTTRQRASGSATVD